MSSLKHFPSEGPKQTAFAQMCINATSALVQPLFRREPQLLNSHLYPEPHSREIMPHEYGCIIEQHERSHLSGRALRLLI